MLISKRYGENITIKPVTDYLKVMARIISRLVVAKQIAAFKVSRSWKF